MIYDLHNDLITSSLPQSSYEDYVLTSGIMGVKGIVLAIWTTKSNAITASLLSRLVQPFKGLKTKVSLCYAIEDLHFITQNTLYILDEIPLSYIGLTWNYDNALAGGAFGEAALKPLGRAVLLKAREKGIAIDTAHLNRRSFFDVIDAHEGKIINSHCCFNSAFRHPRNLSDDQILLLVERGGIIGMTLEKSFLAESDATVLDAVKHIDCFVQKFGCGNLCIGSDFNGSNPPDGLKSYADFQNLKSILLKKGYTGGDVDKIFFENAINFFND